jgi:hypothetical protein
VKPVQRARTAIGVAWLLFWMLMVTVAVQDYLRDGGTAIWQPVLWECSSMLTATVLLLAQRRATRRFDHLIATPWRWFGLRALLLPLVWALFVPLAFGIRHGVYALLGQVYVHEGWAETWFYESVKLTVFISMFALIEFGILSYLALLDERLRASQANALLRQAQLNHLSRQMQPHFLFNALNTISSLMHADVDKADTLLVQLADVLRASLDVGDAHVAPLALELKLVRGYARVMQARYEDRVRIDWEIDAALLDCQVPVMSLQPLLENVFKHTVERRRGRTGIAVRARREGALLALSVEDDGGALRADSAGGPGLGLANLRARLAALHGDAASLRLRQLDPAGVRAELRLPCAC